MHLSGHEDGEGNEGYGLTNSEWEAAVRSDSVGVARHWDIMQG